MEPLQFQQSSFILVLVVEVDNIAILIFVKIAKIAMISWYMVIILYNWYMVLTMVVKIKITINMESKSKSK